MDFFLRFALLLSFATFFYQIDNDVSDCKEETFLYQIDNDVSDCKEGLGFAALLAKNFLLSDRQ